MAEYTAVLDVIVNQAALQKITQQLNGLGKIVSINLEIDKNNAVTGAVAKIKDQFDHVNTVLVTAIKGTDEWKLSNDSVLVSLEKIRNEQEKIAAEQNKSITTQSRGEQLSPMASAKMQQETELAFQKDAMAQQLANTASPMASAKMQQEAMKQYSDLFSKTESARMQAETEYDVAIMKTADLQAKNAEKTQVTADNYQRSLDVLAVKNKAAFATPEVKAALDKYNEMVDTFGKGAPKAKAALADVGAEVEKQSALMHQGFSGIASDFLTAIEKSMVWAGAMTLLYGSLRQLQDGIQYIKDLNKELVNLQMITNTDASNAEKMGLQYNVLASQLGSTTLEVVKSAEVWQRQGKSIGETNELIKASTELSKISGMTSEESSKYLTATINAYKLNASEATSILDKFVVLANSSRTTASVSVQDLNQALQKTASVSREAGLSLDETLSMIATIETITQKPAETVGENFRMFTARYMNVTAGKNVDEFGDSINNVEKNLRTLGIETRNLNTGEFKPMGDVLDEMSKKWDTLGNTQKIQIASSFAGVRAMDSFLALMNNYNKTLEYQKGILDDTGKSQEAYAKYLDSVEASQNRVTDAINRTWQVVIKSDTMKSSNNIFSYILEMNNKITEDSKFWAISWIAPIRFVLMGWEEAYDAWSKYAHRDDYGKSSETANASGQNWNKSANAPNQTTKPLYDFATSLDDVEKALKPLDSILGSYNSELGLTTDQLTALTKIDTGFIDYTEKVNGKIILQTDALKNVNIELINKAINTARANGADDNQIKILTELLMLEQQQNISKIDTKAHEKAYQDVLKDTIDMIKSEKEAEKQRLKDELTAYETNIKSQIDALKQKADAEKQALQDQEDAYKAIIDNQIAVLDNMKQQLDYQDQLNSENKSLTDIENQLTAIQFDNSQEANAKRLTLEDQKSKQVTKINKLERDNSITLQKQGLDTEYKNYKAQQDAKIKDIDNYEKHQEQALNNELAAFKNQQNAKIKAIDDYLKQAGLIESLAANMLANDMKNTLDQVEAWIKTVGGHIMDFMADKALMLQETAVTAASIVKGAFEGAKAEASLGTFDNNTDWASNGSYFNGTSDYSYSSNWANNKSYFKDNTSSYDSTPSRQTGAPALWDEGGFVGANKLDSNHKLGILMNDEYVMTPEMQSNLINKTLPNIMSSGGNNKEVTINIPMIVNCEPSKQAIQKFEQDVTGVLVKVFRGQGFNQTANNYGV